MIMERAFNDFTDKFCCTDLFVSCQDKESLEKVSEMVEEIDNLLEEHFLDIETFITREFSNGLIGFLETLSHCPNEIKRKLNIFIINFGE